MFGSLLAQLIALAISPVITRIYSPESFGFFANISAIAAVLIPILTLSFSMAVVLPRRQNNALALTKFTTVQSTVVACFICFFGVAISIDDYFNLGTVSFYELVLFAYFLAIFEIFMFWLLRNEYFLFRAKLLVLQAILVALLKLVMGYFYPNENSLLYASMGGLAIVSASVILYSKGLLKLSTSILFRGFLTAKTYAHIAKYRTPQNLLANFNQLLPIIILTYMYGAKIAGMYALARTVLLLPGNLISKSISDVLFPKLNGMYNTGEKLNLIIIKTVSLLASIGLLPLIAIFLYGEQLFAFVFGNVWLDAGKHALWLSIWLYFSFINKPYVTLIPILKLEKVFLINSFLNSVLTVFGLWLGFYLYDDANYSIALFCIFTIIPQLLIIFITSKNILMHDNSLGTIDN
jgi:O-antigen/teichoic acid export membrane protein